MDDTDEDAEQRLGANRSTRKWAVGAMTMVVLIVAGLVGWTAWRARSVRVLVKSVFVTESKDVYVRVRARSARRFDLAVVVRSDDASSNRVSKSHQPVGFDRFLPTEWRGHTHAFIDVPRDFYGGGGEVRAEVGSEVWMNVGDELVLFTNPSHTKAARGQTVSIQVRAR